MYPVDSISILHADDRTDADGDDQLRSGAPRASFQRVDQPPAVRRPDRQAWKSRSVGKPEFDQRRRHRLVDDRQLIQLGAVPRVVPVRYADERQRRRVGRSDVEVRQFFPFGRKSERGGDVVAAMIRLRGNRDQRRQMRQGLLRLVLSEKFVQVDPFVLRLLPHQFDRRAAERNHLLADAEPAPAAACRSVRPIAPG